MRGGRWRVLAAVAAAILVMGVVGVGVVRAFDVRLFDEWVCSEGSVPVDLEGGGSACVDEGGDMPEDATLDPLGNRPFDCEDRDGWVEVVERDTDRVDCFRDDRRPPAGWEVRP